MQMVIHKQHQPHPQAQAMCVAIYQILLVHHVVQNCLTSRQQPFLHRLTSWLALNDKHAHYETDYILQ